MKNYGMMEHGFIEATEFEGVMPLIAEKVGVIGGSDIVVKMHGIDAKGMDALEVMDAVSVFKQEPVEENTETPEENMEGEE